MSHHLIATERVFPDHMTCSTQGTIVFEPSKFFWLFFMSLGGLAAIFVYPSLSGFLVFLLLSALTLCAGHSVGMHRLLIHRSFKTPKGLEYALVYLGTLVGMAGPFGMMRAHHMRDWHQRQFVCPPHPSHGAGMAKDAFWQLGCRFALKHPPRFKIEDTVAEDRFNQFLERTWMLQQLPLAFVLYLVGGLDWVLWGVCLRVAVSLIGHWAVGHVAHHQGQQAWKIQGLPVQGYNLPKLSFITFGESLHGNHHAFPHSAQLGLEKGQKDLGFLLIQCLAFLGLASYLLKPFSRPKREGLVRVSDVETKISLAAAAGGPA